MYFYLVKFKSLGYVTQEQCLRQVGDQPSQHWLPDCGPPINQERAYAGSYGYFPRLNPDDGRVTAENPLGGLG
jgi:hypothetical protein